MSKGQILKVMLFSGIVALGLTVMLARHGFFTPEEGLNLHEISGNADYQEGNIYDVPGIWTDQDGKQFTLAQFRGSPSAVVFFYTNCPDVCPVTVKELSNAMPKLSGPLKTRLQVIMISMDPEKDTPQAMKAYAKKLGLDPHQWHLLRGEELPIKKVAGLFYFLIKPMEDKIHHFEHHKMVGVVDDTGLIKDRIMFDFKDPNTLNFQIQHALN
ncbi:MAG: SCO family protein [Deltaproteobacteria bacterium]|nr:SCO family protein [Deltaproteobacteria bacterium]